MKTASRSFKAFFGTLLFFNILLVAYVTYLQVMDGRTTTQAHRIDIRDSSGKERIVISNEQNIPDPIIGGKKFQRAYKPAGLIFYDRNGDERGGIAITDNDRTNLNALAFDYQNADAVGILAQDDKDGNYFRAGLLINDKDLSGRPGSNINRINLITENGNAALVIKDPSGRPRIILKVDSLGNPSIEKLDSLGYSLGKN